MVDTINPNTGQPDVPQNGGSQIPATEPDNRFYGGFDKPDETKINLAESAPSEAQPVAPAAPTMAHPEPAQQPVQDVNPVKPSEVQHTTYTNKAAAINWRGIMVIVLIGLVVTCLLGAGLYFGLNYMNNAKIEQKQAELDALDKELLALSEFPEPLELPEVEAPVQEEEEVTETPVVETPVVTPTPIETPQTPATDTTTDGKLGTG